MTRFSFLSALLFGFLAHGAQAQTLSYNSPDSVLISKSENFKPDTSRILVGVYIIKGFKADKDGNGFDCKDPYILRGNKEVWGSIWNVNDIPFFDSGTVCSNDAHQWSFDVQPTDDEWKIVVFDVDKDGINYRIDIGILAVENLDAFQDKRTELEDNGTLLSSGSLSINSRNQGFDISDDKDSPTSSEALQELPSAISLNQNYPNPFNPQTTITYQIDSPQHVRLDVFNAQGQRIQTLVDGMRPAGQHSVRFDAVGLSSGLYVYRLQTSGETLVRKMILVR